MWSRSVPSAACSMSACTQPRFRFMLPNMDRLRLQTVCARCFWERQFVPSASTHRGSRIFRPLMKPGIPSRHAARTRWSQTATSWRPSFTQLPARAMSQLPPWSLTVTHRESIIEVISKGMADDGNENAMLISEQARNIHKDSLVWDTHACFRLDPMADLSELKRYRDSGVNFVSLNIGMDLNSFENTMQVLARYRSYIASHPDLYVLALTVDDIRNAKESGKLAIAFDLEGSDPLLGNLNMISFYYDLGVRQMLLAYNKDNRASGGCMEGDIGLTDFGRDVVREMNRVGMVVDVSHMGYRATLETFEVSTAPVIFSHSNPNGLREHARNIS